MGRSDADDDNEGGDCRASGQRLDKWLWHARFARTRSAAARLVRDGVIRVGGKREGSCARRVRVGDVLTIAADHGVFVVRLRCFAARRGSATEAQGLYDTVDTGVDGVADTVVNTPLAPGTAGECVPDSPGDRALRL